MIVFGTKGNEKYFAKYSYKYNGCIVANPVGKCKIIGAGLNLRVCEPDVLVININSGCGGLEFRSDIIFDGAIGGLGIESIEEPIGSKLGSTCLVSNDIVGELISTCISCFGLNKIPLVAVVIGINKRELDPGLERLRPLG